VVFADHFAAGDGDLFALDEEFGDARLGGFVEEIALEGFGSLERERSET